MKNYIVTGIRLLFLIVFLFLISNGGMMLWLGLFVASLVAALFFGSIYCGYVCPMNTVMIPTEWISKRLKIKKMRVSSFLVSGKFAWFTLVSSILVMVISKKLWQLDLALLLVWLGISILVTLVYKPSVFHNLICPFGAVQRTFGRFAQLSNKVDRELCIGCKLCEKVCPSEAIVVKGEENKAYIDRTFCFQCTNCQQICPVKAINYTK